jgi:hypothetical protein
MPIQLPKQLFRRSRIETLRLDLSGRNIDRSLNGCCFLRHDPDSKKSGGNLGSQILGQDPR